MDAVTIARQHCQWPNRSIYKRERFDLHWSIAVDHRTERPLQIVVTDGELLWDLDVFRPLDPDDDSELQMAHLDFWVTEASYVLVRNLSDRIITRLVVSRSADANKLLSALAA